MTKNILNPVDVLSDLIRCPSVTPKEAGTITFLEKHLSNMGFECHRLTFSEEGIEDVTNLYARFGTGHPHIAFCGHVDVVPPGAVDEWTHDPFGAVIEDGILYGRGAVDMKGGLSCFLSATSQFLENNKTFNGSISFIITGDEEGGGTNGAPKIVNWLKERGEKIDFCLIGEPTSQFKIGDTIKIGRRGTCSGILTITGKQGHVAYPHLADNPIPRMVDILNTLQNMTLDTGNDHFEPSKFQIVTIDVGNTVGNITPEKITARFNIRFNDHFTGESISNLIRKTIESCGYDYDLKLWVGGESFITPPDKTYDMLSTSIEQILGYKPSPSTGGGTSDARHIKNICPVIEFGPVGDTMHQIDERVPVAELHTLTSIYLSFLNKWFDL